MRGCPSKRVLRASCCPCWTETLLRVRGERRGLRSAGAALLTGVGASAWPTVEAACDATITVTGRDEPVADWAKAYEALYPRYGELSPALKLTWDAPGA